MFPMWEHQVPKQCTAEVSLATNTVLQHRISYHCHHPACMPDLCNRTNKSSYSAYYWKRTEITAHEHFPAPQHLFCRSLRVLCPYSFPAGILSHSQREKKLYLCCKLNARSAGRDLTYEKERARVISKCLLQSAFLCPAESLVRQSSPAPLTNYTQKNKTQTPSFALTPEVPSCLPHHQVLNAVRTQSLAQGQHNFPRQVLHVSHPQG